MPLRTSELKPVSRTNRRRQAHVVRIVRQVRSGKALPRRTTIRDSGIPGLSWVALAIGALAVLAVFEIHTHYIISLQSPVQVTLQWPVVIAERTRTDASRDAQVDQHGRALTAYQQYACDKFGSDCRVALAIQRTENPVGKCETYHYNSDGTLDWGYFQINTVHLKRPGLNLRDLLDCRTNIDFAYQLYSEHHGFSAWSTYNTGAYLRHLQQ